jgi:hypothetical protein
MERAMRVTVTNIGLLMLLSTAALGAQVYKWVDAQGVTHFDAQPPAGQVLTPLDTRTPPTPSASPKSPAPSGADSKQREADAKVRQEVAEAQQRTDEYCDQARNNLAQLTNNPRVRQEVDGELRRLTEQERQGKISELQSAIGENCQ